MAYEDIKAIQSVILDDGVEQDTTVLFIDVKSVGNLEKERLLRLIAKTVYVHRGLIGSSTEGTFSILFNVLEKQTDHEYKAMRSALDIQEGAKRFKSLKLGFGINSGKIIVSPIKNNAIHYMCLKDLVSIAKKLSSKSQSNILISKNIYNKVGSIVKVQYDRDLTKEIGTDVYLLSKILDNSKYSSYLQRFIGKMNEPNS